MLSYMTTDTFLSYLHRHLTMQEVLTEHYC